jgi:hypothetical protein
MKHSKIEMDGKFILDKVSTLPEWTEEDEGRLLYESTTNKCYIGGDSTAWTACQNVQPDWDSPSGEDSYIENKPVVAEVEGFTDMIKLTQSEYDALGNDATSSVTIFFIVD